MILVDDQAGSKDLFPYIKQICPDTFLTRLDPPFGDICWAGEGRDGKSLQIGVEYKQIDDVLQCMVDGRFAGHQLPGLVSTYDRVYLLVEMGRVRADRNTGVLQKIRRDSWYEIQRGGRGFTYRDLEHWFTTIEEQAQVRVVRSYDIYESARWVVSRYSWWTQKGWDEHKSLKQFHVPAPPSATFVKPGIVRRIVKEFKGVGWERAVAAEGKFESVLEAVCAPVQEWEKVEGIGKGIAKSVYDEIRQKIRR